MFDLILKNGTLVNEGQIFESDIAIKGDRIEKIAPSIDAESKKIIDLQGKHVLPGLIDDQVHFREPGLTHKATIGTESRAAVAGGVTTFIEMPNTVPQATTMDLVENKFEIAAQGSWANYSFMLGGTNENLKDLVEADPTKIAGIKLFLGSSTGNMLVDDPKALEAIFSQTKLVISVHCEDEVTIKNNLENYYRSEADLWIDHQIGHLLMEKHSIQLPDAFLKRWLLATKAEH